jgi:hypothetical protein
MPDDETESTGGSERIWHPAHEWLEEDELTDSRPAQEAAEDDGGWEDEMDNEDGHMAFSIVDGRSMTSAIDPASMWLAKGLTASLFP